MGDSGALTNGACRLGRACIVGALVFGVVRGKTPVAGNPNPGWWLALYCGAINQLLV